MQCSKSPARRGPLNRCTATNTASLEDRAAWQARTKDSGDGKWYIRPHHLESLTKHPQSVKDDVLNTRYFSHYDQTYGKPVEINKSEEAISKIEEHIARLRSNMRVLLMGEGKNAEMLDEMMEESDLQR